MDAGLKQTINRAEEMIAIVPTSITAIAKSDLQQLVDAAQRAEAAEAKIASVPEYARYYRSAMWEYEEDDWRGEVLDLDEWIVDGKPRTGSLQKMKRDWRLGQ
jgi:hypothetical protein